MDRKETAERIKIMQAFVDGKQIEFKDCMGRWCEAKNPLWNWDSEGKYRIKPEPKYRPFKNGEECWQEMQKHQPFGVVVSSYDSEKRMMFQCMDNKGCNFYGYSNESFVDAMEDIRFADGTPFGIKEE